MAAKTNWKKMMVEVGTFTAACPGPTTGGALEDTVPCGAGDPEDRIPSNLEGDPGPEPELVAGDHELDEDGRERIEDHQHGVDLEALLGEPSVEDHESGEALKAHEGRRREHPRVASGIQPRWHSRRRVGVQVRRRRVRGRRGLGKSRVGAQHDEQHHQDDEWEGVPHR